MHELGLEPREPSMAFVEVSFYCLHSSRYETELTLQNLMCPFQSGVSQVYNGGTPYTGHIRRMIRIKTLQMTLFPCRKEYLQLKEVVSERYKRKPLETWVWFFRR